MNRDVALPNLTSCRTRHIRAELKGCVHRLAVFGLHRHSMPMHACSCKPSTLPVHLLRRTCKNQRSPGQQVDTPNHRVRQSSDLEGPGTVQGTTLFGRGVAVLFTALSWSPDGQFLAYAGMGIDIRHATGGTVFTYQGHRPARVEAIAWSPDGTRIASGGFEQVVQVWRPFSIGHVVQYRGHTGEVHAIGWAPNGKRIASGGRDQTVQVWESYRGEMQSIYRGHTNRVNALAWSPTGKHIVSASDDRTAHVWEAATRRLVATCEGHTHGVEAVAWSPDGKYVTSAGGFDGTVRLWDAAAGECIALYRSPGLSVWSVSWSPDGRRIAIGGYEAVEIVDAASLSLLSTYHGHSAQVAWSPDGNHIASRDSQGTIQVWEPV